MQKFQAIQAQLEQRFAEIQERLKKVEREIQHKNEPLSPDFAEQAVQRENDEVLTALDDSIRAEMQQIQTTLQQLRIGEYGICAACQIQIPVKRLSALPYANLCVTCAEKAGA